MRGIVLAVMAALALAACSSTRPIAEMSYSEVNALAEQIIQRCVEQGFPDGHPQQEDCLRHEADREIATRQLNRQRQQALGAAFQTMGQSMQQNRATTCNTTYTPSGILGRPPVGASTTCY